MRQEERLLAAGGLHALEGPQPCQLSGSSLEDQHWKDALVVRATAEGTSELVCGSRKMRLVVVKPARLDLVLVEDHVAVGQRFHVRAVPRDDAGRELEIGKWTEVTWRTDPTISPDNDRSAAEFGLGGGAHGVAGFRAAAPTTATIEGRLGNATGTLKVTAK
jgi:hypothetical protein